jgi:tetratricopeptide (TPR) repeat protein
MAGIPSISIFISSPGDVFEERTLAQRVIERLQSEYAGRAVLVPIFWEHEPLVATADFQTQIAQPSTSDIMVAILWSRLGTRLAKDFTREDGSRYDSGTEYEFEDAVHAFEKTGKPQLLVYKKTATPSVSLDDSDALMDRLDQKKKLDGFVRKWFHDSEEGTLKAAFHSFESPSDFEIVMERHLHRLIDRLLPKSRGGEEVATAVWKKGSPFRGLQTFDFEHAPIFFGRTKAIANVLEALRKQAADERAFVLVLGMSGGGKSSLARAGVMPMLTQPGVIEGVGLWRRAIFRPSDVQGDLFLGLATAVLKDEGLKLTDTTAEEFAEVLKTSPVAAVAMIKASLGQDAAENAGASIGSKAPQARLALLVDQMEEVFTQDWVTDDVRKAFVSTIDALARSGRVWVLGTMRSDLYPRCTSLPQLIALKEGNGQYDLMPPTATEIGQMVRLPTLAAALRFEENHSTNERLDDMLRDAAAASPELLPLLQFTLQELYERKSEDGILTLEAYHELGGVEGSLARRAETVFEDLPSNVQSALPKALNALVHIRHDGQETVGRRRASVDDFDTPEAKQLLDAFVNARLFVTELDENEQAAVMVSHEALLWHWPRLDEWVQQNKENLRVHGRLNRAAERWLKEDRNPDLLLPTGKPLGEGKSLIEEGVILTVYEKAFLDASMAQANRTKKLKAAVVAMLAVLAVTATGGAIVATQQRKVAEEQRVRAEIEAQTAQRTSEFIVGLFEVSDPSEARGNEILAREILDAGAGRIDTELADEPEIQAKLMDTIGKVYTSLGLFDEAIPLLQRSVDQRRRLAVSDSEVADSLGNLGEVLALKAELDGAEAAYTEALEKRRAIHGEHHPLIADALTGLAYVKSLKGEFEESESLLRQALEMRRETLGDDNEAVAENLEELGLALFDQGEYVSAEELLIQALEMRRRLLGSDPHPDVAENINNLALVAYSQDRLNDAQALFREALDMKREMLDESHPEIAIGMNNLAFLLHDNGNLEGAEQMYIDVVEIQRRVLGEGHPEVAQTMINLGSVLNDQKRREEAIALAREALEIRQTAYKSEHPEVAKGLMTLAQWLEQNGETEEAESLMRDALEMRMRLLDENHPDVFMMRVILGNLLADQGRYEEACDLGAGTPALLAEPLGVDHWRVAVARSLVGACLAAEGKSDKAEAELLNSLEHLDIDSGPRVAFKKQTLRRLIQLYGDMGRTSEMAKYRLMLASVEVGETG